MLIKTILNRIQKYKSFIYTYTKIIDQGSDTFMEVGIEPRKNSKGCCSVCGRKCPGYDSLPERRYEFIPMWGIKVFFIYTPRRVECPFCGVVVEKVPWADGKHSLTNSFRIFLSKWAKKLSWKEVAESFNVSWEHVFRSVKYIVKYGLENRCMENITAIGVDEIKYKFGQKYITLVYQLDLGARKLLYIGRERKAKVLSGIFDKFGKKQCDNMLAVCTDMWDPYLKAIREKMPLALNIIDRFHIKKHLNDAVDKVRRQESAYLYSKGYEPILEKSRWPLLKNPENLNDKQHLKIKDLMQYNLKSVKSYLLKNDFEKFWLYKSPFWAERFLDDWTCKVMHSGIGPMKKFAKTLRKYQPLIMNWFKVKGGRLSSGPIEGLNNKAKVTIRKAYGFREYNVLKMALFHQLGKLPEPEVTHKFC